MKCGAALCAAVWNTTDEDAVLKSENLKAALEDIFATEGGQFEYQTANLTRYQMKALSALARIGGTKVFSADFLSQAGMPSSATLAKTLKRLIENRLIYLFHGEYRFFNPFLSAWILRHG